MAELREDPIHKDRYFVSEFAGQPPQLGAQVASPQSDLTVYWSGQISRQQMLDLVREAARAFSANAPMPGRFIAYGKDMRAVFFVGQDQFSPSSEGTVSKDDDAKPLEVFDACRAELAASSGKVVVWASVNGVNRKGLEKGGENIGVSVPPDVFDGAGRSFITHAIELTMGMKKAAISPLLDKFSENLLHRQRPAAG